MRPNNAYIKAIRGRDANQADLIDQATCQGGFESQPTL
jgi:hypothetical protein